ncbi:TetR/AcrR family transcriptional regulator [Microbacteriaceae bacterium 4G12]
MARKANPNRRIVLLDGITEALYTRPIGEISFRTLAESLGVSTYTLVYHFGTREELLQAILQSITDQQSVALGLVDAELHTVDDLTAHLEHAFDVMADPGNRQLQRIEIEAAMLGVMSPDLLPDARRTFDSWLQVLRSGLSEIGLDDARADIAARMLVDGMYGIKYDLVLTADVDRATDAFRTLLDRSRQALGDATRRGA